MAKECFSSVPTDMDTVEFEKNTRPQLYIQNHFCNSIDYLGHTAGCLKITEKVSFNVANEASYVYIFSGQKLIKSVKNGPFWRVFENLKLAVNYFYQTGQF